MCDNVWKAIRVKNMSFSTRFKNLVHIVILIITLTNLANQITENEMRTNEDGHTRPPKRVPSVVRYAATSVEHAALGSLQASPQAPGQSTGVAGARPAMHSIQSYSVRGQRSSGQLTGKPAGAQPDYRGRWCAVSQGHPGRPKPFPTRVALGQLCAVPWELPSMVNSEIA
ncbi:UNVERIFIED_CONTAM: hypothetical protein FKN15_059814 [Acipenser sinensis]